MINLYRRPYSEQHRYTENAFVNEYEVFLDELSRRDEYLLFTGDFNLNLLDKNKSIIKRFLSLLQSYNLCQFVKTSTHIADGLLDLVILDNNLDHRDFLVTVDKEFRTDHYPVCISLKGSKLKPTKQIKYVREIKKMNFELFSNDLQEEIALLNILENQDVSDYVRIYNETLSKLFNKHCKEKKKIYRENREKSLWYNKELHDLKTQRRKAERKYKKKKTTENRNNYRRIRNLYNRQIETTRSKFYCDKFSLQITELQK